MKSRSNRQNKYGTPSPSARRVWVEISVLKALLKIYQSPSARRVWVEMGTLCMSEILRGKSPSARRVWVEIGKVKEKGGLTYVTLREEGVG